MKLIPTILTAAPLFFAACASTAPKVVATDAAHREALLGKLAALEGDWREESDGMELRHEIRVTSAGSAVREIMFPGSEHEMVNMYTLDGNSLVMTHYCASGNQPRMRATDVEDGKLCFEFDGVSDLKQRDERYMGSMTLVLVDDDTIEEHWTTLRNGAVDHEMVMHLTRVR